MCWFLISFGIPKKSYFQFSPTKTAISKAKQWCHAPLVDSSCKSDSFAMALWERLMTQTTKGEKPKRSQCWRYLAKLPSLCSTGINMYAQANIMCIFMPKTTKTRPLPTVRIVLRPPPEEVCAHLNWNNKYWQGMLKSMPFSFFFFCFIFSSKWMRQITKR